MGDEQGATKWTGFWGQGTNEAKPVRVAKGMLTDVRTAEHTEVLTRHHATYTARVGQIAINRLGWKAGRPYINARLTQFPGESDLRFKGGKSRAGSGSEIKGRKEQAHVFPYLQRIVNKVNQYLFGTPVDRTNATTADKAEEQTRILADISRSGTSITQLMKSVSSEMEVAGWCWVGVDMPHVNGELSEADKTAGDIRPYWRLYTAPEVVDWKFDGTGALLWLILERIATKDDGPAHKRQQRKSRVLWERDMVTEYIFRENGTDLESVNEMAWPHGVVPFILGGEISGEPMAFDSLEGINRTIMDLNSASRQNFFEWVFPQRALPASFREILKEEKALSDGAQDVLGVIGAHTPIWMAPGDPVPMIISPNSSDMKSVREECTVLKQDLFEVAGMMVRKTGAAAESAEAKQWDHLEIEQGLKDRAQQLAEIEIKAVALSVKMDPSFPAWVPKYSKDYRVHDFIAEMNMLIMAGNVTLPVEIERAIARKMVDVLGNIGFADTPERLAEMLKAIEESEDPLAKAGGGGPVPSLG